MVTGRRYLLGPLYLLVDDVDGALASLGWYENAYPGASRFMSSPRYGVRWSSPAARSDVGVDDDVCVKGDLDDVVHAIGCERADAFNHFVNRKPIGPHDVIRTRLRHEQFIAFRTYGCDHGGSRMLGERDGAQTDSAGCALHEHDSPVDRPSYMYCAMVLALVLCLSTSHFYPNEGVSVSGVPPYAPSRALLLER